MVCPGPRPGHTDEPARDRGTRGDVAADAAEHGRAPGLAAGAGDGFRCQSATSQSARVNDSTVTFQCTVGQGFTLTYTGEVDEDTPTLTPSFDGGQGRGHDGLDGLQTLELTRQ